MKITYMGAAQTVTGSCYIIEAVGKRFSVDCGMHQGSKRADEMNTHTEAYSPRTLDFILLTHAHIDHSGLLPRMVQYGFKGNIYCTAPTADFMPIMLRDSAHIQEVEAEWANKKLTRHGNKRKAVLPLYTIEDAEKTLPFIKSIEYNKVFEPCQGVKVTYHDAGHILGSALLEIEIMEEGKTTRLAFSGDLGRPNALLVNDATLLKNKPDYLFMESTYGDRNHKNEVETLDELAEAIAYSYSKNDKVLIPAFALERTQEILFSLYLLKLENKLPDDMPIFVDSPMAIQATEVFSKYSSQLDLGKAKDFKEVERTLKVQYTLSVQESMALNSRKGAAIVISASGMCNAGRIKHHLKNNAYRDSVSIVFVGFQAMGTPGRRIVDGERILNNLGESLSIAARVFTIGGFSAHAGQSQLLDWLTKSEHTGTHVILVHGEANAQKTLAELINKKLALKVSIPSYLETMILKGDSIPVVTTEPSVEAFISSGVYDWDYLAGLFAFDAQHLQAKLEIIASRSKGEQEEFFRQFSLVQAQITELLKYK